MIEPLEDLPEGVIGFETRGKLHADDYRDVLLPAVEKAEAAGSVRLVLVIADFDGLSGGALWQDLKMGVRHLSAWKRIAVVTDIEWMTPGEAKHFAIADRAAAFAWAAG